MGRSFSTNLTVTVMLCSLVVSSNALSQTVKEEWLRQAGITCGGGQSVDVEGNFDAAILKKLRAASVEGSGSYNAAELKALLEQFGENEKSATYQNYIKCLLTVMDIATSASDLPRAKVVLDGPAAPAEMLVVKHGQKFTMKEGDTVAVLDARIVLTLNQVEETYIGYAWSNSESGPTEHILLIKRR